VYGPALRVESIIWLVESYPKEEKYQLPAEDSMELKLCADKFMIRIHWQS